MRARVGTDEDFPIRENVAQNDRFKQTVTAFCFSGADTLSCSCKKGMIFKKTIRNKKTKKRNKFSDCADNSIEEFHEKGEFIYESHRHCQTD